MPHEANVFADEISKWWILDDWSLCRSFFNMLDCKWAPHTCDLFSSNENNLCINFFFLPWCGGTSGVKSFDCDWGLDNCWINAPFRLNENIWRKLKAQRARATIIVSISRYTSVLPLIYGTMLCLGLVVSLAKIELDLGGKIVALLGLPLCMLEVRRW